MIRILHTLILAVCFTALSSQTETGYLIRNFSPKEYAGFNQVWCSYQDKSGVLYFGSSTDILTYNGATWGKIFVKRSLPVRAIHEYKGRIYVGSEGDFGYLQRKKDHSVEFKSMLDLLPEEERKFTDVWKILEWNGKLVFHTYERTLIYDGKSFVSIKPQTSFALAFVSEGRFFIRQRGVGMMEVQKDLSLKLIKGGEWFANIPIVAFAYDVQEARFVACGSQDAVLFYDEVEGQVTEPEPAKNQKLKEFFPLTLNRYNKDTWFMTSRNGFLLLNNEFEIQKVFNKSSGLYDEVVTGYLFSQDGNLWLTLNNGISMIEWSSDGHYFTEKSGYKGAPSDIVLLNGYYYLSTTNGVYKAPYMQSAGSAAFSSLDFPVSEYWELEKLNNKIYCAASGGVYELSGGRGVQINEHWTRSVFSIREDLPYIVALQKNYISIFDVTGVPKLKSEILFEGEEFSHALPEINDRGYTLWLISSGAHLSRLELDKDFNLLRRKIYTEKNGVKGTPQGVYTGNGTLFLSTGDKVLVYDPSADKDDASVCFIQKSKVPFDINKPYTLSSTYNGKLYLGATPQVFAEWQGGNRYLSKIYPLRQDALEFTRYITDDSMRTWFLGPEYLVMLRNARSSLRNENFNVNLIYAQAGKDSSNVWYGMPTDSVFSYQNNTLSFEFSAAFYTGTEQTVYRCRLLGREDTAWTKWSRNIRKEYTNLHEGDYSFHVQAINAFGNKSHETVFHFTILPPWYRTGLAYFGYVAGLILLVFGVSRITNYRLQRSKQKLEKMVNDRTYELQEKKKEITDSIKYALRIQTALLPPDERVKKLLPQSFVYYKPKDIVSGDFYWVEEIRGKAIFAAVDCTGHGVPGAMMSVIGLKLLNSSVIDRRLDVPSDILSFLDKGVHDTLRQGDAGSGVKDGMDLAICTWDKSAGVLEYAGVFNSLWIVRKNIAAEWKVKNKREVLYGEHLLEIKADKLPIGTNTDTKGDVYTNHYIKLQPGDMVYIYSDGYADQFGGPLGKKFKYNQLKDLLVSISGLPVEQQQASLSEKFESWKGSNDQIDDVLVMGVRI